MSTQVDTHRIGLTAGCPAGVGPELLAKSLVALGNQPGVQWIFFGPPAALALGARRAAIPCDVRGTEISLGASEPFCTVTCQEADIAVPARWNDEISDGALHFQRDALVAACQAGARGELSAIFTGPIRKKALQDVDGKTFPGQTELCHSFLAKDERPPLMCFTGGPFVLALATVHLPLREVAGALSRPLLVNALERLAEASRAVRGRGEVAVGAGHTRVSVLGLNPHAGEEGLLGREEAELITPTLASFSASGVDVKGPVPADGFFAQLHRLGPDEMPDGVLAMFHDQGLCGYKALCQGQGVNLTWGLKIPRTSPDHGTADALVGRGTGDPASTLAALRLAMHLSRAD